MDGKDLVSSVFLKGVLCVGCGRWAAGPLWPALSGSVSARRSLTSAADKGPLGLEGV